MHERLRTSKMFWFSEQTIFIRFQTNFSCKIFESYKANLGQPIPAESGMTNELLGPEKQI